MALEPELDTFQRELPQWLADPANLGQFALIQGDFVAGLYPTFDAALSAGYDKFGLDPFLVKQVAEHDAPLFFTRNLSHRCR